MSEWKMKPAADLSMTPNQRALASVREPGLGTVLLTGLTTGLSAAYLKVYHRMRVEGREHLPTQTPFVLVANHASHLDHACLRAALPARLRVVTMPLAAGDVFFTTWLTAALTTRMINALPMWRKKVGPRALGELRERLEARNAGFILFPEGARTRNGELLKFKAGIGMLVAGLDVPVVPAWLEGPFRALGAGKVVPRPVKITVRFGPALRFGDAPNSREGWERVMEGVEVAVRGLRPSGAAVP